VKWAPVNSSAFFFYKCANDHLKGEPELLRQHAMQAWLASLFGRSCLRDPRGDSCPTPPPPEEPVVGLFTLPPDVLLLVAAHLPLHTLSCLAVVSHAAAERLPDEAFRAPLERCRARAHLALGQPNQHRVREPISTEAFLMSGSADGDPYYGPQQQSRGDEEDDLVAWLRAASAALDSGLLHCRVCMGLTEEGCLGLCSELRERSPPLVGSGAVCSHRRTEVFFGGGGMYVCPLPPLTWDPFIPSCSETHPNPGP